MGCERCLELAERVAWLEAELGLQKDRDEAKILMDAFSLTETEVWFLRVLYRARGRIVDRYWLLDNRPIQSLDEEKESSPLNVVRVYVSKLRNKLGHGCIMTARDQGYALTADGLARLDRVLVDGRVRHDTERG